MATLEQLQQALIAADKAGATDDAKMLAHAIIRLKQGPAPVAEAPAPMADVPGVAKTMLIGAGRTFDRVGKGMQQLYYGATGNDAELANLKQSAAEDDRLYQPLKDARPIATGIGESLPSLAIPAGGGATLGANVLRMAAAGAIPGALEYGTAGERGGRAALGALSGAAVPLAVAGVRGIAPLFHSPERKAVDALMKSLDEPASAAASRLRGAAELVPGAAPTVGQALGSPKLNTLERVVSETPGGDRLKQQYLAQNAARLSTLDSVAPIAPTGFRQAQQDLGESVARFATGARGAAKAKTSALYNEVPQDEAMLYLPELGAIRDKYFGPGVFGGRGAVDDAVSTANKIGTAQSGAVAATKAAPQVSLLEAVKRAGGINQNTVSSQLLGGEVKALKESGLGRVVYQGRGQSVAKMAEKMREAGYLPDEDPATLIDMLRQAGRNTFSDGADMGSNYRRAMESAMGDLPGATSVPQKVSLKDFEDLRRSIGGHQRAASMDPSRATEAKALGDMKAALDARIDEVVRGDGKIDEVLPIDWADKLTAARKSKVDEVARFGTGPQAAIFRKGSDGQPLVQGGEVAAKFWGNRPGLADDVKSFRRLIDDNPELLGKFRSLVTTEGAKTATNGGNLTGSFARWVSDQMPGLHQAFPADKVAVLERIAQDIKRADAASAAGLAKGSATYQNAQHALSAGMLDNPLIGFVANRIPIVNQFSGPILGSLKDAAKRQQAAQLAGLLADPTMAADALTKAAGRGLLANNPKSRKVLEQAVLRAGLLGAPAAYSLTD